jgi:hypothetical protein
VFFGMIGVTLFGLLFTPSFYVINRTLADWVSERTKQLRARFGNDAVAADRETRTAAPATPAGEGA